MAGSERSRSFGLAADVYETGRPEYPSAAIRWLLEPVSAPGRRPRVADVGAGTGKLTRGVAATGCEVVAVDPDPAMLAKLREAVPGVPTLVGTAETLPLPDAGLDAVVLGQAWHWVEPVMGSREIGRVLRPGGVLGLIWNVREQSEPWLRRLTAIMPGGRSREMFATGPPVAAPFGEPVERTWPWSRPVTRAVLADMIRSRSHFITAPPERRAEIDADLAALFDEIGLHGEATTELPYVTHAYRAVRP
ncbi:MAG TPA: class I SAM-dependent methyltransferase [Pseudonocardia sp.]|jgi:SAM-dependent methyltransferase|nr:class I SAM-dependent methyltransferase [Pseudonocardia sp.]